jgi:hypothetical protein
MIIPSGTRPVPSMLGCNLPQFAPAEYSLSVEPVLADFLYGIAKHYLKL